MSARNCEKEEELRAAIKVLFEFLTYEEQEEIINLIKSKRQNDAESYLGISPVGRLGRFLF